MKTLNPYINYFGKCREALDFYKKCFGGEIVAAQTFEDAKMEVADEYKQRLIHSEFKAEGIHFMATDGRPDDKPAPGSNISLAINFTDEKEQQTIFDALAEGGTVIMPLGDSFWGARFGMLADRYGVHWMLNCQKQ
jgi:PhnB protein